MNFDEGVLIFNGEIVEKAKKDELFSSPRNKPPKSFLFGELIC